MRKCNRLLLAAAVVLAAGFAPIPAPRTGVAEAVVNAFGGGPTGVRQAVLAALPQLLPSERVKKLACLKGEKDPAAWLGKRLRVEEGAPRGPVRLRLDGCRPNEALALLTALVDAYEARHRAGMHELDERVAGQVRVFRWVAQGGGGIAGITLNERNF